ALLSRRWTPARHAARTVALGGAVCIVLVLGWGDLVHRHLFGGGLYVLCGGACLLLLAFRAHPPAPRRSLGWLARMGALSYELYLSHMFVVLALQAAYRALAGPSQTWTFVVYLPMLWICYRLAAGLERLVRNCCVGHIQGRPLIDLAKRRPVD
ncbi:MAG: acyltransferase family protein, partial [Gammaproteobacteria bacterium]